MCVTCVTNTSDPEAFCFRNHRLTPIYGHSIFLSSFKWQKVFQTRDEQKKRDKTKIIN